MAGLFYEILEPVNGIACGSLGCLYTTAVGRAVDVHPRHAGAREACQEPLRMWYELHPVCHKIPPPGPREILYVIQQEGRTVLCTKELLLRVVLFQPRHS